MPVSKNRRKSKKALRRKVNRAKSESSPGWGRIPDSLDYPPPASPDGVTAALRLLGISTGGTPVPFAAPSLRSDAGMVGREPTPAPFMAFTR